ncbi:MAG: acylneuraminate cytidylyltransferase [Spirochaetaceae bacterium]|nr:acylneuraminate cytidylyltransferase [Spirochaetaceae bacterium]
MVRSGKIAVFLQARIGSARLPSKTLLQLGNMTTVSNAMVRLKKINADYHVLLTDKESITALEKEALQCGFDIMEGPGEDVLKRFTNAIEKYNPHTFIRATADNPLVFYKEASLILEKHLEKNADHSWFLGMPLGAGVEIVKAEKLLEAERLTNDPYDREHVTPYIYKNSAKYMLNHLKAPEEICYHLGRITIDTLTDYNYLQKIFCLQPDFINDTVKLVEWLKQNPHPDVKNADVKT